MSPPEGGAPQGEKGVRFVLDHVRGSDPVTYRGQLDGDLFHSPCGARSCEVEVVIAVDAKSPDGMRAAATLRGAPPALEADLARTAAVMVKSAVRRAQREGLPPPRRIHRWREH